MQLAVVRESFDRGHLGAVGLRRQHRARLDRLAVDEHRAGSAQARLAADVGSGQPEHFSEVVHQEQAGLHGVLMLASIYLEADWKRHGHLPRVAGRNSILEISANRRLGMPPIGAKATTTVSRWKEATPHLPRPGSAG